MEYFYYLVTLVGIYVVLAASLDLLVGNTGVVSVSHATFYGVGAYATAILIKHGLSFWKSLPVAVLCGAVTAFVVGMLCSRLRGDYLALGTFAVGMVGHNIMVTWESLTQGPFGITGIHRPGIGGSSAAFACLVATFAVLALCCIAGITRFSAFADDLRAIRDDEIAALSLGTELTLHKSIAFGLSGAFAALGGSLYACWIGFVDPSGFTVSESILILSMVILGGAGSVLGVSLGAILLAVLPELLRFARISPYPAALHQMVYGLALVVLMARYPKGFLGKYEFE